MLKEQTTRKTLDLSEWLIVVVACGGMAMVVFFVVSGITILFFTHEGFSFRASLLLLPILWGASTCVKFLRFRFFKRALGFRVDGLSSLKIYFCGVAFSMTPGRVGELIKSHFLYRGYGFSKSGTLPIIIGERVTDMLALALFATLAGMSLPRGVSLTILLLTVCGVGCFCLARSQRGSTWVIARVRSRAWKRVSPERLHQFLTSCREVFSVHNLSGGCLYSGVARCLDGAIVFTVVTGLGAAIQPLDALGVLNVAAFAGGFSQLPGGVGVAEGGMAGLLIYHGLSGEMAIVATVIARTFTWWLSVLVGFGVWLGVRREFARR